ncbi:MAG: hypothetical protein K6B74_09505, partial [Ruminococcus sp.]|nr:hypothetical protein [Ruminococcus sp.]
IRVIGKNLTYSIVIRGFLVDYEIAVVYICISFAFVPVDKQSVGIGFKYVNQRLRHKHTL